MTGTNVNRGKGFTLLEVMLVMGVTGIITGGIYLRNARTAREHTEEKACLYNRSVLARAESRYYFDNEAHSGHFQDLADSGYISRIPECPSGGVYAWLSPLVTGGLVQDLLVCSLHGYDKKEPLEGYYILTLDDGVFFRETRPGFLEGSYSGVSKNLLIPAEINGEIIKTVDNSTFRGKELVSVRFAENSGLENIWNHAFRDNLLTEIVFPESLKSIGNFAFYNNNSLSRITIGAGVEIGNFAFHWRSNAFRDTYESNDKSAGTYIFIDGEWIKE